MRSMDAEPNAYMKEKERGVRTTPGGARTEELHSLLNPEPLKNDVMIILQTKAYLYDSTPGHLRQLRIYLPAGTEISKQDIAQIHKRDDGKYQVLLASQYRIFNYILVFKDELVGN